MCEVHAYLKQGESEEKIMESVELVEADNGKIRLRNIYGEQKEIAAAFHSLDNDQGRLLLLAL